MMQNTRENETGSTSKEAWQTPDIEILPRPEMTQSGDTPYVLENVWYHPAS